MSRLRDVMDAVRTNPHNSKAWSNLGDLLMEQGQVNKAKESYQRALQLDHHNKQAQEGLANALAAALPTTPPEDAAPSADLSDARTRDLSEPSMGSFPPASPEDSPDPPLADGIFDLEDDIALPDTITFADTLPEGANISQVPPIFRDPEPQPEKPSQARLWLGVGILSLIPLFCLCSLLLLVAYFSPW